MGTSTDIDVRQLMDQLHIVAQLEEGKTLSVKELSIVNHNVFNSWYRWWNEEDRHRTIDYTFGLIDQVRDFLEPIKEETPTKRKLLSVLQMARKGIESLLLTYRDDTRICARVNTLLVEIQEIFRSHHPVFNSLIPKLANYPLPFTGMYHRLDMPR